MIVDSHCHLNYFDDSTIQDVVDRATDAGVALMQTVCTTLSEFPTLLKISNNHKQVYASVGVHPCNSVEGELASVEDLIELAKGEKVIGLGETGLDFYKYKEDGADRQEKNFVAHISAARESGLPVIIHSRNADAKMADICASEMKLGAFKGVMHCFASSMELAKSSLDVGLYISFSGILTFKNATSLREIAKFVPRDRVLVETDSPFLCPEPHRGKTNSPAMTKLVVECLSQIWGETVEVVSEITTRNFFTLFDKCSCHYNAQ
ncbi:MAG: TatD family hydrolase [Anaplasma ovis]|uniref:LuxR family transcriptional regulator n=1 Tax=Anaplasma ovis str. Haibei TaxID=1248439 RepID=A0A2Z2LIS2_9RICK|nr:TatD family hydrolase [Anaplasma ovis]ASI48171.1 LuxR family transcriptional regulator [Anaplasma ovis str. Haibei]